MLQITGPSDSGNHGLVATDKSTNVSVLQSWSADEKPGLEGTANTDEVTCGAFNVRRYAISSVQELYNLVAGGTTVNFFGSILCANASDYYTFLCGRVIKQGNSAVIVKGLTNDANANQIVLTTNNSSHEASGYIYIYS